MVLFVRPIRQISGGLNSYDTPTNSYGERFLRDFCMEGNFLMSGANGVEEPGEEGL